MVQIPILAGIYTDTLPDFRTAYPVNMMVVPKETGISGGYLRPADGIVQLGTGPGIGRGGIVWNGVPYRVMGTSFGSIAPDGTFTTLGDVGAGGRCRFDYSFDLLAINSGNRLYYWNGATLVQVTDLDLLGVNDIVWIDGYFMTTDGEFLVVTELTDPTQVNPLKYGSSEIDPDPVLALLKLRNEIYAVNRNTIEVFDNVGGELFPFQRNEGAQIPKGAIGRDACCIYLESVAFLGSGRNEALGVYIGVNASAQKISTQEIDTILEGYTEAQLASVIMEVRNDRSHQLLYVHLPDQTLVYDAAASQAVQQPAWTVLVSDAVGNSAYRARNMLWAYDAWQVEDPNDARFGTLTRSISSHWGEKVRWEFATPVTYQEGNRAIVHRLELVALTGSVAFGEDPRISTSYSIDGVNWSQDHYRTVGRLGDFAKRLTWLRQGAMSQWRVQRFRGTSDAHIAVARLEAQLEALAW